MNKTIKVGSRESVLAVRQAEIVMECVKKNNPELDFELVTMKTRGDEILDKSLDKIGGKGLFINELENALLNRKIDIAVHSYKDMPYDENGELPIVALSKREEPFDVLVLPKNTEELDMSKPIGSSSLRRSIQLMELYEGVSVSPIRGNVLTRLEKLDRGGYSAVVLAQAGLNRLSLHHRITRVFTSSEMLPSASQGILAVQGRKGEGYSFLREFHSKNSEYVSLAERGFLKALNGGCSSPVAAFGEIHNNEISLLGMYVDENGAVFKGSLSGGLEDARRLGERLATMLKERAVKA